MLTAYRTDDLIEKANLKMKQVEEVFKNSTLQAVPDKSKIEALLITLREAFYEQRNAGLEVAGKIQEIMT